MMEIADITSREGCTVNLTHLESLKKGCSGCILSEAITSAANTIRSVFSGWSGEAAKIPRDEELTWNTRHHSARRQCSQRSVFQCLQPAFYGTRLTGLFYA